VFVLALKNFKPVIEPLTSEVNWTPTSTELVSGSAWVAGFAVLGQIEVVELAEDAAAVVKDHEHGALMDAPDMLLAPLMVAV